MKNISKQIEQGRELTRQNVELDLCVTEIHSLINSSCNYLDNQALFEVMSNAFLLGLARGYYSKDKEV